MTTQSDQENQDTGEIGVQPLVSTPVFRVTLELDLEAEGIGRIWRQVELPVSPFPGMYLSGLGEHAVFDVKVHQVFVSVGRQDVTLSVTSLAPEFEPLLNQEFIESHGWSC